jgi:hypothetical protein
MRFALVHIGGAILMIAASGSFSVEGRLGTHSSEVSQPQRLTLSVYSSKRVYRRRDQFRIEAMLRNTSDSDLFIFGGLGWGYLRGLMFHIKDSTGREVEPVLVPDSPPEAPPDDVSGYVKLRPDNFLGTSYFSPVHLLNLKPGRYSILVQYESPFSISEVPVRPYWGKENGVVNSNVIWFAVQR